MVLQKHLSELLTLPDYPVHGVGIGIALAFHFRLAALGDSTKSCNLLWCVLAPSGIGNKRFGCTSWGFSPILFGHLKYGSFFIFSGFDVLALETPC